MKRLIESFFLGLGAILLRLVRGTRGNIFHGHRPAELSYQQADSIALDLVSHMSLDEKLAQMSGDITPMESEKLLTTFLASKRIPIVYSGRNERLRIPPFAFSDGPRGVVTAEATAFPVAVARAASWDRDLEHRIGDAMGRELRAAGANYFGGVCINLLRHPAWGRAQESYGEDPWLQGEMAVAVIDGVQKHNVMACAKHYALNSIENSRFKVDVQIDERTLREVYLPHFKKAVDAGVASIMSAYNKVRGEHCGHNRYLLTDILRNDWGFQGFVTSDWMMGLRDGVKGVNAGMDVEMPIQIHYGASLAPLIESGAAPIEKIDEMVRRIVRTKLLFTTRTDPQEYDKSVLADEAHRTLAREAAAKSMVLLKNEGNLLPFRPDEMGKCVVIGHLATEDITGDRGSSATHPPYIVTALQGIERRIGGTATVVHVDGSDIAASQAAARDADAVVFIVGYDSNDEGEHVPGKNETPDSTGWGVSGDRPGLSLKPDDVRLLQEVAPQNPNNVVVLIGGSAIMMEAWKHLTPAILMAWYPGMEGGAALANILFGSVNPSGKLPFTIPTDETHLPFFESDIDSITYGYYHGYTLLEKNHIEPAFPFGFGLSYTTYRYENMRVDPGAVSANGRIHISVDVTNTGDRTGEEIVQLYVGLENSRVDRPRKLLRGFAKTSLAPGETRTVTLPLDVQDLAWYNPDASQWEVECMRYSIYVGSSSRDQDLLHAGFVVQPDPNTVDHSKEA